MSGLTRAERFRVEFDERASTCRRVSAPERRRLRVRADVDTNGSLSAAELADHPRLAAIDTNGDGALRPSPS
jgi:hypothetical protein